MMRRTHGRQCMRGLRPRRAGAGRGARGSRARGRARRRLASTSGSRWPPTSCPSRFSADLIAIGLPTTRSSSIDGLELPVERARRLVLAGLPEPDQLLHLRPDDVRVHADPADAAELEERQDQVVVARVEVEPESRRCASPRARSSCACLTALTFSISASSRDRLRLDVDHDAAGDVVDDDRLVRRRGDRLEVLDDPALRRLVVVRRHDRHASTPSSCASLGQVDRVARVVRARARDDGRAVADLVERRARRARSARRRRASAPPRSCPATTRPSEPLSTR